jgi:hypothetical protein
MAGDLPARGRCARLPAACLGMIEKAVSETTHVKIASAFARFALTTESLRNDFLHVYFKIGMDSKRGSTSL